MPQGKNVLCVKVKCISWQLLSQQYLAISLTDDFKK